MAESFDAVLAEMREWATGEGCFNDSPDGKPLMCVYWAQVPHLAILDRLQSAHEAEVAEVRESARHEAVAMGLLADRAVGLLRECAPYVSGHAEASHLTDGFSPKPANEHDELAARLTAFLSEQAGERENATKDPAHED